MPAATLSGVEAAGQDQPAVRRRTLGQRPVEHLTRTRCVGVEQDRRPRRSRRRGRARVAGGERHDQRLAVGPDPARRPPAVSWPCSCTPRSCGELGRVDHELGRLVPEDPDGERSPAGVGGRCRARSPGVTWRGLGAKTNPTASAPRATAISASSSLVTPQIFTNTRPDPSERPRGSRGTFPCGQPRSARASARRSARTAHADRVTRGHQVLADQHGVVAGRGERHRVAAPSHPGLRHAHGALGHQRRPPGPRGPGRPGR